MTSIEMKNICKSYGEPPVTVLDNMNLTLRPGITSLMGPSGVGKTTLAHILAGLVKPDGGEITGIDGVKVAMVFQEDRLLEWTSALKNVLFVSQNKFPEPAVSLLTQAGLGDELHKKAAELSGGMKRRVALCRALLSEHDLLILDEPFKGLDDKIKPAIIQMVRRHEETEGKIVLCITHDAAEAEALGGTVIRLK
jgi:NitT/TauT family transport system ATP-binding protein